MKGLRFGCAAALLLFAQTSLAEMKGPKQAVTYWTATRSDGGTFVLELFSSGAVRLIPESGVISKGSWKRAATSVDMKLNGKFLTLSATVEGDLMKGVGSTKRGDTWTWSATRQPRVVQTAAPVYPALAAAAMVGETVLIEVEIGSSGEVKSIRSIRGHPLLRKAASMAARKYKFEPADPGIIRTARLTFSFRRMPVASEEDTAPLILSPFHIALRYRPPAVETSQARLGTYAVP